MKAITALINTAVQAGCRNVTESTVWSGESCSVHYIALHRNFL